MSEVKDYDDSPIEHDCNRDDGTFCEECCDHQDADDYCCLDCGKELTEDRMALAYDMAKDARKYGDV